VENIGMNERENAVVQNARMEISARLHYKKLSEPIARRESLPLLK